MRRIPVARVITLGLLVWALAHLLPQGSAQGTSQKVSFRTFDKVDLVGTFYVSSKDGKRSPTVLILHKIGGNREPFAELAKELQKAGLSVLTFDFRGHGESTAIDPADFWKLTTNLRGIKGANAKNDKIGWKEFTPSYLPMLVNDIAAAKFFIEEKLHNSKECNVGDLMLIGAEDGGALGALFMAAEWNRKKPIYKFDPIILRDIIIDYEKEPPGRDITAAVWLSLRPQIGTLKVPVSSWFSHPQIKAKVPMCFFYGKEDANAAATAKTLIDTVLRPDKKMPTFRVELGTKLAGHELLNKADFGTEGTVAKYLTEKVMELRVAPVWTERDCKSCPLQLLPLQTLSQLGITLP